MPSPVNHMKVDDTLQSSEEAPPRPSVVTGVEEESRSEHDLVLLANTTNIERPPRYVAYTHTDNSTSRITLTKSMVDTTSTVDVPKSASVAPIAPSVVGDTNADIDVTGVILTRVSEVELPAVPITRPKIDVLVTHTDTSTPPMSLTKSMVDTNPFSKA